MIINLWGTMDGRQIVFDPLPNISFMAQQVCISEILIQWKSPRTNFIGVITSSLIERTALNQYQELLVVPQEYPGRFLFYQPTHLSYYKIQLSQLTASVFEIDTSENLPKIEKIYIQLKVADVGLQSVTQ